MNNEPTQKPMQTRDKRIIREFFAVATRTKLMIWGIAAVVIEFFRPILSLMKP